MVEGRGRGYVVMRCVVLCCVVLCCVVLCCVVCLLCCLGLSVCLSLCLSLCAASVPPPASSGLVQALALLACFLLVSNLCPFMWTALTDLFGSVCKEGECYGSLSSASASSSRSSPHCCVSDILLLQDD
jgi:hypothetical protein